MERTKDAERLRKLYEKRVPEGMSQTEFGQLFEIGTQGMVSQYLTGHRPLNIEAAAKFARGLGCTIADISPDMARRLRVEVFPVLGRVTVKAAVALVLALIPPLLPSDAEASTRSASDRLCIKLNSLWRWLRRDLFTGSLVRLRTIAAPLRISR